MQETFWNKLKRKCSENPFIPLAIILSFVTMGSMLKNLLKNDKLGFQISQRLRLGAQTLGISAFAMQIYLNTSKNQISDSETDKS